MARSYLRIPEAQATALARLASLTQAQSDALSVALRESKPSISITGLARQILEKTAALGRAEVHEILRVLATLYTIRDRDQSSPEAFLVDLESAAKESGHPALKGADVNWDEFRGRLGELLAHSHSLGVTSKAVDVLNEHDRVFCDARALTDARPVFAANIEQGPDAVILVHELRISYHQGGQLKATYITLDSEDVRELRSVLDRATAKEASVEKLFTSGRSDIRVLKARSHEG